MEQGRPLTDAEVELAREIGVRDTGRIRLLVVPHIPIRNIAQRLMENEPIAKPIFRFRIIGGLASGFGIVIDEKYLEEGWLLAHELAHIRQFERLGQEEMLRQVLLEHQILRGKLIPIEREAIAISEAATGIHAPAYH